MDHKMFELFLRIILVKISKLCGYMVVIFEKKELISKISTKTETANFYYAQAPLAKILLQRSLCSRKLLLFSSLRSHENTTICARFAGAQKTTMSEASLFTPGFGTVGTLLSAYSINISSIYEKDETL